MKQGCVRTSMCKIPVLIALVFLFVPVLIVQAATITAGATCSLDEAINSANNDSIDQGIGCAVGSGADTINLTQDVTLQSGMLPEITSAIIIDGSACNSDNSGYCEIDGNDYRIFDVGSGGNLTLQNVILTGANPSTKSGGAVKLTQGSLTLTNVTIKDSSVTPGGARGGGIHMNAGATSLTITNSTISGNSSVGFGGGVSIANNATGSVTISGSTISGNSAGTKGGGLMIGTGVTGAINITNSTIHDNEATGAGGGLNVEASSTVVIKTSAFTENSSGNNGGAIYNEGTLTVENSTFSANTADSGISGGIYARSGTLTLTHVTMAANTSNSGGGSLTNAAGTSNMYNSLLAGTGTVCNGRLDASEGNLIQGGGTCRQALEDDPLLGTLTGSPAYYPLQATSPAIDAGVEARCLATDQLGNTRTAATCDIGAIEQADGGGGVPGGIVAPNPTPAPGPAEVIEPDPNPVIEPDSATSSTASGGGGADDSASSQPEPEVCTGEVLQATSGIRVSASNGICGSGVQFVRVQSAAEIGNDAVIAAGWLDAVDVWGWVAQGVEVCFPQHGEVVFLDAATSPRTVHVLDAYQNAAGMTCVSLSSPGTVVLLPLQSAALSGCQVTTMEILNLRETPGGNVINVVWVNETMTAVARTQNWFQVGYLGDQGWISADYVEPQGDCGA